jgi:hypothetical protein
MPRAFGALYAHAKIFECRKFQKSDRRSKLGSPPGKKSKALCRAIFTSNSGPRLRMEYGSGRFVIQSMLTRLSGSRSRGSCLKDSCGPRLTKRKLRGG